LCGYHYSDGCLPGMSARVLKDRQMEREGEREREGKEEEEEGERTNLSISAPTQGTK
jgi:hypothetical protein